MGIKASKIEVDPKSKRFGELTAKEGIKILQI